MIINLITFMVMIIPIINLIFTMITFQHLQQ